MSILSTLTWSSLKEPERKLEVSKPESKVAAGKARIMQSMEAESVAAGYLYNPAGYMSAMYDA